MFVPSSSVNPTSHVLAPGLLPTNATFVVINPFSGKVRVMLTLVINPSSLALPRNQKSGAVLDTPSELVVTVTILVSLLLFDGFWITTVGTLMSLVTI